MADAMDKTEAPTLRRRLEARKRGQVARSADLVSAAVLMTAILLMQATGPKLIAALRLLLERSLSEPAAQFSHTDATAVVVKLGWAFLPLFAGVLLVAIVANLIQFGFLFRTPHNEDAFDISKGFARLFSPRSRAKLLIDIVKLVAIGWLGYSLIRQCLDRIVGLQQLDTAQSLAAGTSIVFGIGIRICVLLLTLGVLDYAYQRWQHERDLRMSRQEVKDELRQMDGDPRARRNRREFSATLANSRQEHAVALANVLVTHENQLAIAIRFDRGTMQSPQVIAKAARPSVAGFRAAAIARNIPIVEREPLARTLSKLAEINGDIPHQLYAAVAEVLNYAAVTQKQGGNV